MPQLAERPRFKDPSKMNREELLKLWFDTKPTARSPYGLYGHPAMWETFRESELVLFSRPGKTMTRPSPFAPYEEVDGVHYQWQRDGQWVGQGCQCTFEWFESNGPSKVDIGSNSRTGGPSVGFDWSKRVGEPVLALPFVEGLPTPERAQSMTAWIRENSDRYANKLVILFHATDPSLPIEREGLKPTSTNRRRSYQAASGYVYLANTPERAKNFGDLGNQGRSVVYEVVVRIRHLLADMDQLNNQRSVGRVIGDSIGESIVYGGGARIKGRIEPWAVRKMADAELGLQREHESAAGGPKGEPMKRGANSVAVADSIDDLPSP
jgi:hypothetical protein